MGLRDFRHPGPPQLGSPKVAWSPVLTAQAPESTRTLPLETWSQKRTFQLETRAEHKKSENTKATEGQPAPSSDMGKQAHTFLRSEEQAAEKKSP